MTDPKWLQLITARRQSGPVSPSDDAAPRLHQLQGIRAVVFDVYGTLFSSGVGDISLATEENRDAALRSVLSANGIALTGAARGIRLDNALHGVIHRHQENRREEGIEFPEVDIRRVWADFLQELLATGLAESGATPEIETLVIDYETRINPTQPMPGLAPVLASLRERGLILSIISNAQFYTPLLFEAFLGQSIADLGFSTEANVWSYVELEGKPSQQLYRLAAERLHELHQLRPDQCLYVGNDMRNDIWPARALGFRTALFAGDRLSLRRRADHPACKNLSADCEITELAHITSAILPEIC